MKKRKLIDLPKPTLELLARCAAALKPPPAMTLSEWADRYRVLSAESSAEPGRWHTDKAPYQREIMDAIGDPHIRKVVIMSAAQIGKTDAFILNPLGYYMDYAPAPILVMQPTLDMGQTFSKDRLAPMIRDTPELRDKIDVKSRYSGNTIMKKNFPGGHITIVGANSATGLASRPIKVLLADEVDRYPASAGTEGDPLSLAQKRQTTFWDKKTVIVSTPVIKGQSRIETEFNQSTREEWNVPCPECGHYQPFVWANVVFDKDDPQGEVLYKCEHCGVVNGEYQWKQASKRGRFVPENPGAEARGFHLNTLASTFCSWKEIVQKFLVAKEQLDQGNPEGMKVWVNTELGETWEEQGEQVEDAALLNRRELYDADVPEGVLVLTAGVDVQDDRFEVEVVGWGIGKESWGIRYQKIYGDTSVYDASVQLCAELNSANHGTVKLRFGVDGDWRVSAGNCIALTGFGNLNGKYFVDKVTHKVSSNGLTTDFECSGIGPTFHSWDVGGKIVYHEKTADSGVSYDSTYATTSPAAGAASAAAGGEAGQAITLNKAPLYVSSTAKNKAGTKTGTYWLYDGILINGRYRVTNSAARCGKLPVGQNVTGWVPASYCIASEEAKK